MNREEIIEKLSRLTEARGATPAEALVAREKIAEIRQRIAEERRARQSKNDELFRTPIYGSKGVYVDGWPRQKKCDHRHFSEHNRTGMCYCYDCKMTFIPEVRDYS